MFVKNPPFAAQIRRYNHLAKQLRQLLKDGQFLLLSFREKRALLSKLKHRLGRIGHLMPQPKFKGALASIAILLGTSLASPLASQNFAPYVSTPFGLDLNGNYGYPAFADLDGDGDFDVVINGYDADGYGQFLFYKNSGTAESPVFTPDNFELNPFGITSDGSNFTPNFVDMDNDGDLDLLSGSLYDGSFAFQENIGSATAPAFGPAQTNPFGLASVYSYNFASAADIDGDGDIDVLGFGLYGTLTFFENIGTPSLPAFNAPVDNPFGLAPAGLINLPHLTDLDSDGDMDLLTIQFMQTSIQVYYSENTGTIGAPSFEAPIASPFGLGVNGIQVPIPTSADMDNDGDMDVMISDYYGAPHHFFENLDIFNNFAPTASNATVEVNEDEPYSFNASDFNFTDGNISDQLQAVQVTNLPSIGDLLLSGNAVTLGQVIDVADFANFTYKTALNESGANYANFNFKVYDGGLWSLEEYLMSINANAVNDLPTTLDASVLGTRNSTYFFKQADFTYSDIEGDAFAGLRIASLPSKGSLRLNANPVVVGQTVPIAGLPNLNFTPALDEFGQAYTNFNFQVFDGTAYSTAAEMTIDVQESSADKELLLERSISLSPNPATESIRLKAKTEKPLVQPTIQLVNGIGAIIQTIELPAGLQVIDYELDTRDLLPGFYFIKLESGGKFSSGRFVKQ